MKNKWKKYRWQIICGVLFAAMIVELLCLWQQKKRTDVLGREAANAAVTHFSNVYHYVRACTHELDRDDLLERYRSAYGMFLMNTTTIDMDSAVMTFNDLLNQYLQASGEEKENLKSKLSLIGEEILADCVWAADYLSAGAGNAPVTDLYDPDSEYYKEMELRLEVIRQMAEQ